MRFGLLRAIELRLRPTDLAANYLALRVGAAIASNYTLTLPASAPSNNQALQFDSSGNASWVSSATGTVSSVALSLPALFSVTGSPVTTSGTLTASFASQTANTFLAAPNGSAGAPTMRAIVAADIPKTLDATWITNFDTQVRTSRLDQMAAPTAAVGFNGQRATNAADPTSAQDLATKAYVDATAQGLDVKQSVRAASTANVTISAPGTAIDGVTLSNTNRVLLKNQTAGAENGIWIFNGSAAAMTRATDANSNTNLNAGAFVFVEEGTTNSGTGWVLTTANPITVGTTSLTFAQFSGAGVVVAGNGLLRTGNTLDVVGTSNRISVSASAVDIAATYVGQSSITTLGTITTGTWTGTAIAVANGGTGATTAAAARTNLGTVGVFRGTFTSSSGSSGVSVASSVVTITHNLGQTVSKVEVSDPNGKRVSPDDVTFTNSNSLQLDMSIIGINTGTYSVVLAA